MKRFVYTIDKRTNRGDVTGSIYRIRNSDIEFVTEFSFRLGSCRGEESEAFNALMDCGEIPKKYYNSSVTSWSGPGYFFGDVRKNYDIKRIGRY